MAGCNQGLPYNLTVKISGCTEEEFTCDDGQCVGIEERCDQVIHCRDQTDEQDCRLLVLKKGYKKNIVPFTIVSHQQLLLLTGKVKNIHIYLVWR